MRVKLMLVAVMAAMGALVAPISPASAQVDYSETCALAFTPPSPFDPGEIVTVEGTGFPADFATELFFDDEPFEPAATVTTDALGEFTTDVTIPADAVDGPHIISAICEPDGEPVDFGVLVGQLAADVVLVVNPDTINCAGALTGFAEPALPGSTVTFSVSSQQLAQATADDSGRAEFSVSNFATGRGAGSYTITATGTDNLGDTFSVGDSVTLTLDDCGPLPRTGSDPSPLVVAGIGLAAVGTAFLVVARRRRQATA